MKWLREKEVAILAPIYFEHNVVTANLIKTYSIKDQVGFL